MAFWSSARDIIMNQALSATLARSDTNLEIAPAVTAGNQVYRDDARGIAQLPGVPCIFKFDLVMTSDLVALARYPDWRCRFASHYSHQFKEHRNSNAAPAISVWSRTPRFAAIRLGLYPSP